MPAPIVLFVYNRPEHTRQTVEALVKNELANESDLWIFSDAQKNSQAAESVDAVRRYIHSVAEAGTFASVKIYEAEQNKGLARSVISGVSQVLQYEDRVIVLEDDLVTAPDFLVFMNACLDYYATNQEVGSISGYSPLRVLPEDYLESVYLLPRSCSWGWATWRDRWEKVDWDVSDFNRFKKDNRARRRFNECGSDRYDRLRRQMESDINSWSVRFGYWQFQQGMNTVYPRSSRISNIGTDGSGVHGGDGEKYSHPIPDVAIPFVLSSPAPDQRIIEQFHKIYSGSIFSQLSKILRNNGFSFVDAFVRKLLKISNNLLCR